MAAESSIIWSRVVKYSWRDLDPATARAVLKLDLNAADRRRVTTLIRRSQDKPLPPAQRAELERYFHVGRVLTMMHARARKLLREPTGRVRRKAS